MEAALFSRALSNASGDSVPAPPFRRALETRLIRPSFPTGSVQNPPGM